MTSDSAVFNVLSNYTALRRSLQAKRMGGAGGFSGSQIWHIAAGDSVYCLRRWPQEHPDGDRLTFIHSVLRRATSEGLTFVPAPLQTSTGTTFIELAGHRWELTPWLSGTADFWSHPSPSRLAAALRALATFHVATASCEVSPAASGIAPAIQERQQRLTGLVGGGIDSLLWAVIRQPTGSQVDSLLSEALPLCPEVGASLLPRLTAALRQPALLQPAIRDIWHDHVLFEGELVTGIVDYGAMRVDTPLTDIARLVGSLVEDDSELRQIAFDAYSGISLLTLADRALIDLLDHSSVIISLANWAQWLYVDGRAFDDRHAIESRILKLAHRLRKLR